ncbi:nucleotidyl transferase AbiEii/AbiGii toxin family protein [Furfurilactobacillus sp. WILCCON 0119]
MRNDMQLKAKIKQEASQIANADRSTAQLLLRNYLTGRMIEKISVSKYRESFIMKGALLLQSRTNELLRTTKDVDFHIDGMNLSEQNLSQVFTDIFSAPTEDGISFDNVHFEPIRKGSEYEGRQMTAMAHFGAIEQSGQADITTGNPVGENAIDYPFPLTLDGRNISIRAYTAEQSAAEKMQTMIARGVDNSRSKDVFDLWLMNSPKMMTPLDGPAVKKAFDTTSVYYGSLTQGAEVTHQLTTLASSEKQRSFW